MSISIYYIVLSEFVIDILGAEEQLNRKVDKRIRNIQENSNIKHAIITFYACKIIVNNEKMKIFEVFLVDFNF